jgi:hypothetical protein
MPPAPPTFSKSTGWPKSSESRDAKIRPKTSPALPAANGYTIVTGRLGQFCALDCAIVVTIAVTATIILMVSMIPHRQVHRLLHDGTRASLRCDDSGLWQIRPSSAPAALDRLAHVCHEKRPGAQRRPLPDTEIVGGEVS